MAARKEQAALLEWLAASIGLAIFAALFGTTIWQNADTEQAIPELVIENQRIVPMPGGVTVLFDVHNRSTQTAAAVVEGRLMTAAGQAEASQVTIDYVLARSWVAAGLLFGEQARGARIEVLAIGYREP